MADQEHFSDLSFDELLALAGACNAAAQFKLGSMYEYGIRAPCDHDEAVRWYTAAAEQGHVSAQITLGEVYKHRDKEKECFRWYTAAAEQGHVGAQITLGKLYRFAKNYKESVRWYTAAAEQGSDEAQHHLAGWYEKGFEDIEQSNEDAVLWYKVLVEKGDEYARIRLREMAKNGIHAAQLFLIADAEAGNADAQYELGNLCGAGLGVAQSDEQLVYWHIKAAEQGHPSAQFSLGEKYKAGQGVCQDHELSVRYFIAAAQGGYIDAQFKLGKMYELGECVDQSDEDSARWYGRYAMSAYSGTDVLPRLLEMAHAGIANAQYSLGEIYSSGRGVEQSYEEAYRWYKAAAEQGYIEAEKKCIEANYFGRLDEKDDDWSDFDEQCMPDAGYREDENYDPDYVVYDDDE